MGNDMRQRCGHDTEERKSPGIERDGASASGLSTRKRPYQKPAFLSERAFETMALSCGKVLTQQQCHENAKLS